MFDDHRSGLRHAYLARLGLEAEPPSVEALQRILAAQLARGPYETTWIALGEAWAVDPLGRRAVGGTSTPVSATDRSRRSPSAGSCSTAAGTTTRSDGPLSTGWATGTCSTTPPAARLPGWCSSTGRPGRPSSRPVASSCRPRRSRASSRRNGATAYGERRAASGTTILRACTLTHVDATTLAPTFVTTRREWFALAADEFGLAYDGVTDEAKDRLWTTVMGAHRTWEAQHTATDAADTVSP